MKFKVARPVNRHDLNIEGRICQETPLKRAYVVKNQNRKVIFGINKHK